MWNKSLFGSSSHLENIRAWKAGSPTSNPRRLKAFFAAVIEKQSVYCTILGLQTTTSWPNPLLLCMRLVFFCSCNEGMGMMQAQCRTVGAYCGSQGPQASGRQWRLRFHTRHGFLRQTDKHVEHISFRHWLSFFQRWAAERPATPLPTHCC